VRRPAEVYAPYRFVQEESEIRRWSMGELEERSGLELTDLLDALTGRPITEHIAAGLARAFGTSAELWLNLDAAYRREASDGTE